MAAMQRRGEHSRISATLGGNETQLRVFGDSSRKAVMADEGRGKADDFAGAEGPRRIEGVGAIDGQGDGAFADDENAGDGIATVEKRGAFAEGNLRSDLVKLGCELSNLCGHTPQQGRQLLSLVRPLQALWGNRRAGDVMEITIPDP
jgi:hypothetical protein